MSSDDEFGRLIRSAESLIDANRGRDALAVAHAAIAAAPGDARPYCIGARALLTEGQYAEAAEMAGAAIERRPNWALPWRIRSLALTEVSRTRRGIDRSAIRDAVAAANEAVALAPNDHLGYVALAQACARSGDHLRGRQASERAIALAPASVSSWVTASVVALEAKEWSACEQACRRALAIEPNNVAALNNLGVALKGLGRWKAGAEAFAAAATANPRSTAARRNLARTGAGYVRIGLLIVLSPILLVRDGFYLYLAIVIGTNIALYRYPAFLERIERQTTKVALRVARHNPTDGAGRVGGRVESPPGPFVRISASAIAGWVVLVGLSVGLVATVIASSVYEFVFAIAIVVVVIGMRSIRRVS